MNVKVLRDLPVWWWTGIPTVMLLLTLYAYFTSAELMTLLIRRDEDPNGGGIAENATVLILLPGIAAGIALLWFYRHRFPVWMVGWLAGWTLACIYFAGEEASWGQHYFHWLTPEALHGLNDQNEMNLHNIGSWMDQKPRTLVELWAVFAGLVVPLIQHFKPHALWAERDWSRWFWPTNVGIPTVVVFLFSFVVALVAKKTGDIGLRELGSNELREFYIALFLSSYLLSLWYRVRQAAT